MPGPATAGPRSRPRPRFDLELRAPCQHARRTLLDPGACRQMPLTSQPPTRRTAMTVKEMEPVDELRKQLAAMEKRLEAVTSQLSDVSTAQGVFDGVRKSLTCANQYMVLA